MSEQSLAALARGNEIRIARAGLRAEVKNGGGWTLVVAVLRYPPECVENLEIARLLKYPRWSRSKVAESVPRDKLGVGPNRTIGRLNERQRNVLADYFEDRYL